MQRKQNKYKKKSNHSPHRENELCMQCIMNLHLKSKRKKLLFALFTKYSSSLDYFYTKDIDDIERGINTSNTLKIQQSRYDCELEHLKQYYRKKQAKKYLNIASTSANISSSIRSLNFISDKINLIMKMHTLKKNLKNRYSTKASGNTDNQQKVKSSKSKQNSFYYDIKNLASIIQKIIRKYEEHQLQFTLTPIKQVKQNLMQDSYFNSTIFQEISKVKIPINLNSQNDHYQILALKQKTKDRNKKQSKPYNKQTRERECRKKCIKDKLRKETQHKRYSSESVRKAKRRQHNYSQSCLKRI